MLLCALSNPKHRRARNISFAALSVLGTVTAFICWVEQSEATASSEPGSWQQREKQYLRDCHNSGNLQPSMCVSEGTLRRRSLPRAISSPHRPPAELALPAHALPGATVQGSRTAAAAKKDIGPTFTVP